MTSVRFRSCALLFGAVFAGASLSAADKLDLQRTTPVPASQPIPVQDFLREPFLSGLKINQTGTHVAAIVSAGDDHKKLMVYELGTKKIDAIGSRGDSDIETVNWLNDRTVAYEISYQKLGIFMLCAADVSAIQASYPLLQGVAATIVAVPPKDRLHPLVHLPGNTANTGKYGEVVTVNANLRTGKLLDLADFSWKGMDETFENNQRHISGRHPIMETPGGFDSYFMADKDGQLAYGVSITEGELALHRVDGNRWIKCPQDLDEIRVFGVGDNSSDIVALAPRANGRPRPLQFMDAATGKPGEVLFEDPAYDFTGSLYRDPVSKNIVGLQFDRAGPQNVWFTEGYRALQKAVDAVYPGLVVRIIGTDDAGKVLLVDTFSDRQPSIYRWVNLEKHTRGDIQNSRPWLEASRMQPMNVMKFKTRDGHKLDSYVTLPAGSTKQKPPPLVVLLNGGERHAWGFDVTAQFLASRGYAVLQPNTRGSAGYGWMFTSADEWDFRKHHEDVTDAANALIASGLVDARRVGIIGDETEGFMAMEGAAFEPALYKCAVAISPVCDWAKTIAERKYNKFSSSWYSRRVRKLGDPNKDTAKFDAISPLNHAAEIRAAVFIAYGEYDPTDISKQAKELVSIVRKNNLPAETMSFVNEGGGIHHLDHRVELFTKIESFLEQNLKGAARGAPGVGAP